MNNDEFWKNFGQSYVQFYYGEQQLAHACVTTEELYQAFKERYERESLE